MKKHILSVIALLFLFISCQEEERVFEKDADTRAAEAIDSLKTKLVSAPHGWLLRYRPEAESGSYYVLLTFNENGEVNIKSDLGAEEGAYFDQTITYRIDNSLGLELIFENYSFFSYLFEQDQASFLAEFEFNYVNETGDGDLVFNSKSDPAPPTIIVLQPAVPTNENLLGTGVSGNISKMTEGLAALTTVLKLSYTQKDVALYMKLDDLRRTIQINYISPKTSSSNGQKLNFSTGYILEGNAIILDKALTGSFMGNTISLSSIALDQLTSSVTNICSDTLTIYNYAGRVSANEPVILETSVFDPEGAAFYQGFSFFNAPIQNIFNEEGFSEREQIADDIRGVTHMQMYFDGSFNALGFRIENPNASVTFALKEFDFTMDGNRIQFDFAPEYTLYEDSTAAVDTVAMNKYVNIFTEGDQTYVYRYSETLYEIYNPCNGWTFFFIVDPDL